MTDSAETHQARYFHYRGRRTFEKKGLVRPDGADSRVAFGDAVVRDATLGRASSGCDIRLGARHACRHVDVGTGVRLSRSLGVEKSGRLVAFCTGASSRHSSAFSRLFFPHDDGRIEIDICHNRLYRALSRRRALGCDSRRVARTIAVARWRGALVSHSPSGL